MFPMTSTTVEYAKSMKKFLSAPRREKFNKKQKFYEKIKREIGWGSGEENWVDKKEFKSIFYASHSLFERQIKQKEKCIEKGSLSFWA